MSNPFRFAAMLGRAVDRRTWVDQVKLAEAVGCATIFCSDHLSDKLGPIPALASAAELTDLNVGTLVLANEFRNPNLLAKDAATLDLLSEGRLELGLGAGWLEDDFRASGIPFRPPGERIDRLEESIGLMKRLWSEDDVDHAGGNYEAHWQGLPKPYRRPHPTLLVGGGGPRMLRMAGREADIVGISLPLAEGTKGALTREIGSVTEDRLRRKVGWVREGAAERFDELELNVLVFGVRITPNRRQAAEELAGDADAGLATPHYLVGTVDDICEELRQRREETAISYIVLQQDDVWTAAPLIEALAGT